MYRTFYVSKDEKGNQIGWVIDVINGEVFARPISFGFETTCDKEILLTEDKEGKFTSYGDGKFYITVPHDTAVTAVTVDKINAGTLDGITFDGLCALTGAVRLPSAGIGGGDSAAAVSPSGDFEEAVEAASGDAAVIVSLGDSFSAGEGIEKFIGQDAPWSEKVENKDFLAHRSESAWPKRLVVPGKKAELHFAAVSGAETRHIDREEQVKKYFKFFGPSGSKQMPLQLDVFRETNGKKVDFVTLTIGGNDAGFAGIITKCVVETSYLHLGALSSLEKKLNTIFESADTIMADLRRVYKAIAERAPYAAILVAGYPELLDENWGWIDFNPQEATLVNNAVSAFNMKIRNLVYECWESGMNIYFVDVEDRFSGHPAYATKDTPWLNPVWFILKPEDLDDLAASSAYSIHPNTYGAQAYADCVNAEIADYAESGEFGSNLHWKYDIRTDTLTISGAGGMPDYRAAEIGQKSIPWYRFMHRIKEVVIEDGVTSIGGCAFAKFDHLTRVEIGSTVSKIGDHAFWNCDKLSAVSDFPERLTDIGRGAFYGTALTEYYFASVPPTAREASVSKNDSSFAFGAAGDTERITLYYPADHQDSWDPDGTGKWKGYHVKSDGLSVSGTVADFETYEPVKDALVQLTRKSDKKVYEAAADGNGRFQVLVSPGDYTLQVSHEGYQTYEMTLTAEPGREMILKVDLKPVKMATLAGSVTTEAGEALKDASITVTRDGKTIGTASSNSKGAFSLQVPAGSCEVKVTRSGYQVYRTSLLLSDTEPTNLSVTLQKVEFTWNLEGDVLTITGSGDMPHYTGYNRPPWYSVKDAVKRIEFDGEITGIGANAFANFTNLTSVTIPASVTTMGWLGVSVGCFGGCTSLTSAGPIGSGCSIEFGWETAIPDEAFSSCRGLTSVTIPDGITSIGSEAFSSCTGLTSITIPDSVTSIRRKAFSFCTGLTSITIPDSVTSIADEAFSFCTGLTSVTIPDSVTNIVYAIYTNGGLYSPFYGCSALTSAGPIGSGCSIEFGWETIIPAGAFYNCKNLTSVIIPGSVTSIGQAAFYQCDGLTSAGPVGSGCNIEFGWNTMIPEDAFKSFSNLTSITIPDSVTGIGGSAFYGCSSLTSATIPGSVTGIGKYAFSGCSGLVSATIPDSVTSIGEGVFSGCSGLTSVTIPGSVTSIGAYAFRGCSGLTSVTIPDSVTDIGPQSFYGCSGLTSVTIPGGVTSIGQAAFDGCRSLTSIIYQGTQAQWDAMKVSLPSGATVTCTGA